jgi:glycosyltransferase involved in cell wall biosynthesis
VLVYGAYPSQKVYQLDNPKERFFIKGRAENAVDVIRNARVLLAPIRFGAGIKGKLLEAMLYGTPSVTTSIGAEAMHGELPWNGFVEDTNESFTDKATELYINQSVWEMAQLNGFEIIKNRFCEADFLNGLRIVMENLMANLEGHRLQNFIGAMLQHHTLQSTHYMAKWIQEKNKK